MGYSEYDLATVQSTQQARVQAVHHTGIPAGSLCTLYNLGPQFSHLKWRHYDGTTSQDGCEEEAV